MLKRRSPLRMLLPLLVLLAASPARAQTLEIGSTAPKFAVKEFVKGQPIKGLAKGKIHVVEFWATWCRPCIESIPHLTELQKKYPQVTFIGVSVWENSQADVKPFVARMGDKMGYRVALDQVPAGATGDEGAMAKAWMQAAEQSGIPTAFVVNGEGKIAWLGHPMGLEEPLAKIVSGHWDLKVAAEEKRREKERSQKLRVVQRELQAAGDDAAKALAVLERALAADASLEAGLGFTKLRTLLDTKNRAGSAAYAKHLLKEVYQDNSQALNAIAWALADPKAGKPDAEIAALALEAALRADQLAEQKDAAIADSLARAYFVNGDARKALETQERALRLATGTPLEQDAEFKARLEEYRKAVREG